MATKLNRSSFGGVIGQLEEGDEITLKAGFGFPEDPFDKVDTVVSVDSPSVLTAGGVMLGHADEAGVVPTGRKNFDYELSDRAKIIMEKRFS